MSLVTNLCWTNASRQSRRFAFGAKLVPIALIIGFVSSGTIVHAACGEHVQSRRTRELLAQMTKPIREGQSAPVAPCHGPGCHRGPSQSPAAPAPVVRDDAGHSAFRAESSVEFACEDGSEDFIELSIVLRDGVLAGIFRPPERAL